MSHARKHFSRAPELIRPYDFTDEYRASLMSSAPLITDRVDPEAWREAVGFDGFTFGRGRLQRRNCVGYVGATETHLYGAIISEVPPGNEHLVTKVTVGSAQLAYDDSIEMWIAPDPDVAQGVAFQMLANAGGTVAYQTHVRGGAPAEAHYGWKGQYRMAHGFHDGCWHSQIEVPIEALDPGRLATQGVWAINLCRNWKRPWAFSCLGARAYNPTTSLRFRFTSRPVTVVQMSQHSDPYTRNVHTELSLHNPGTTPQAVQAQLHLRRDRMPEIVVTETREIPAGRTERIVLQDEDLVSENFELYAIVAEAGGGPACFTRYLRWGRTDEARWDILAVPRPPVDFRFAFYPSLNLLRIEGDVTRLPPEASLQELRFDIRSKGEAASIASLVMPVSAFTDGQCMSETELALPHGDYEIAASAVGIGVPDAPLVKEFQRHVYEWEGNALGRSRKVYKPFEPIRAEDHRVAVALRDYDTNGLGLLDQVWAWDVESICRKPILAAPMRYVGVVDGRPYEASAVSFREIETSADRVIREYEFWLGPCRLKARSTVEYDGMMRVDLTLPATGEQVVESLDLEVPFRDAGVSLMHAMIAGIRYPIVTGRVPEGEGPVWNAGLLEAVECPRNFCTYLWLGDPNRGLAWFAENDAGWSWDPDTPNLALERHRDILTLRASLVNQPLQSNDTRTITFGVQASPVKPRLEGWRHRYFTDRYQMIGTDIKWFALGCCGSVYPARKDLRLWDAIRRANDCAFTEEQCRETFELAKPYFEPYGVDVVRELEDSVGIALCQSEARKLVFYFDRSSSPCIEEFQTFQDEWGLNEFSDQRGVDARYEVKVVPTESYCDFATWWYKTSFERAGNQGIYVDNNYFVACRNHAMTGAYRQDDGSVVPSTGIWQLRELARRQFVLMNEMGMTPFTMVHMTTTLILPISSFYTVQYDWELKASDGDLHTRHARAYIQALTSGNHLGAWPVVLHEQGDLVGDPWTSRTWMGVCLVHEIIIDPYVWARYIPPPNEVYETFRRPILDFVQRDEVQVYRYWDERPQPVRSDDPALPTIVFVQPGVEALWVITNYAPETRRATVRIDLRAMGLADPCTLVDIEDGRRVELSGGQLHFKLGAHDLRAFRLMKESL